MDITAAINEMKKEPGFTQNVGMILSHNGVVRAWSRKDKTEVLYVEAFPDLEKIDALRSGFEKRDGIYKILIEAKSGRLNPGDDLLFIIVAGDIRENVKAVLSELLERIKSEAVVKNEIFK